MRVLFSSVWAVGHVFPMVPLARDLVDAGHEVSWAAPATACHLVESAGLRAVAAGLDESGVADLRSRIGSVAATLRPQDRPAYVFPNQFGRAAPAMAADLHQIAAQWRPDVFVHDGAELAAPLVAATLGRPCVTHSFGGATPPGILEEAGRVVAQMWADNGLDLPPYAGLFTDGYLDICPPSVQGVAVEHIPQRQPLRPVPYTGPPRAPLPAFVLSRDPRPLVYLTLGTVADNPALLIAAANAIGKLPVRLLIAAGPNHDPDALGPQPANVRVERWVAQAELLPHCDLVVSHGGSGTFLGALAHGIPQLCLPQQADQFRNASAGSQRGASAQLHPDDASEQTIGDATQQLLHDEATQRAAREVRDEIREMPSPADIVHYLESITSK